MYLVLKGSVNASAKKISLRFFFIAVIPNVQKIRFPAILALSSICSTRLTNHLNRLFIINRGVGNKLHER